MTNVELVATSDLDLICNLGQLYQYDFVTFVDAAIDDDGRFSFIPMEKQYGDDRYDKLLITVDGKLAGFMVVSFGGAYRDDSEQVWYIDEFFVMRQFRGAGVGEEAARQLFDSRPGGWEVGQVSKNTPAQAFWRKVIGRYTDGSFEEIVLDNERWTGPIQYFTA